MNQQKYYCKGCGREINEYTNFSNRGMCYTCSQYAYIADTFISAGVGDVSEWKDKAKKHRVQALPDGTIKQLYNDEEVEEIARQRDEYKHRAEVAEKEREEYRNSNQIVLRGIEIIKRNILRYCATDFPTILQQAEKELQEEGKNE